MELDSVTGEREERAGRRLALGLVFGILGVSVGVHVIVLLAVGGTPPPLERRDYYQAGLRHEEELARGRRSMGLGWTVELAPGASMATQILQVSLGSPPAGLPARLRALARLSRPGDASLDRTVPLARTSGHAAAWSAAVGGLKPGRWKVRVELLGGVEESDPGGGVEGGRGLGGGGGVGGKERKEGQGQGQGQGEGPDYVYETEIVVP